MDKDTTKIPRITKIWAENYKSIQSLELEIAALTVLVGPNASGKSNIADIIPFVSDVLNVGLNGALANRGGPLAVRRTPISGGMRNTVMRVRLELEEADVEYEFAFRVFDNGKYRVMHEKTRLTSKIDPEQSLRIEIKNGRLISPKLKRPEGRAADIFDSMDKGTSNRDFRFDTSEIHFPLIGLMPILLIFGFKKAESGLISTITSIHKAAVVLRNVRSYRIFPNELRAPQKMAYKYPLDEDGGNLASVLREMIKERSKNLPELLSALNQVVPGVDNIEVTPAAGNWIVKLHHIGTKGTEKGSWFDLSQESDGTLRLLGLLLAIYQDPPPPLIVIEEPELTIHPGALAVIAELMEEAASRTSLVITTHSPDLIDRLPVDSLRAVKIENGITSAGEIAAHQREAVKQELFTPGELHRMEGLQAQETAA